jgi:phospholipase/carboxylesterase
MLNNDRRWIQAVVPALALVAVGYAVSTTRTQASARLQVQPVAAKERLAPGVHRLGLSNRRDGLLVIPASRRAGNPMPLAVILHGAGGSANGALRSIQKEAEELGVILLIPDSRGVTWDAVRGRFGPDVEYLNHALEFAFEHADVDAKRMAIGGFSDGASYALSIGLANGDVFPYVFAFSPGFIRPSAPVGRPRIGIWHGKQDEILPIHATSRRIVPDLKQQGYTVEYIEFDGPHTVRSEDERAALARLVNGAR